MRIAKSNVVAAIFMGMVLLGSCGPQNFPSNDSVVSTAVAATLAAKDDRVTQSADPQQPTREECLPVHPGRQELPLPTGFISGTDPSALVFYDLGGTALGEKQTPGLISLYGNWVHPAGGITNGIDAVPLIYAVRDDPDQVKANIGSNIFQMDSPGGLVAVTGPEGDFTLVVYSTGRIVENGLETTLKIAEMGDLVRTDPQLIRIGDKNLVYYPLAVRVVDGALQGVWFSDLKYRMTDFWFLPLQGLYYFDYLNNSVTTFLTEEAWIRGFSPDQTFVIYGPTPEVLSDERDLIVRNLLDCQEYPITYHGTTNIGGGKGVFSPNSTYVAWIEISGEMLEDSEYRLRVAPVTELDSYLVDLPVRDLFSLVGGEVPVRLDTAGWISEGVLVLDIWIQGQKQPLLVAYAPDPELPLDRALGANQSVLLGEGYLLDFLYP